jgi:Flp pilus assembly protein TadB
VTGKGLLKRVLIVLALTAWMYAFLASIDAEATPIRPDIRKLVEQPQQDSTARSMPARAGWDGPEMPTARQAGANPSLEAVAGVALARAERAELINAATPDPRAILGIIALIFLLRLLRKQEQKRVPAAVQPFRPQLENNDRIAA